MTFDAQETSQRDGHPVVLYEFFMDGVVSRFTNAERDVEFSGNTYTSETIRHSEPRRTYGDDAEDIDISLPRTNAIPQRHIGVVPSSKIQVTIKNIHRTDFANESRIFWEGAVVSVSFGPDGMATMKCRSILSDLAQEIPRRKFQGPCNHILYDQRCGLSSTSFSSTLSIASISDDEITITGLSAASGADPAFFVGGYIEVLSADEFRTIVAQSGDVATVMLPFPADVAAGASVRVYQGCDHSLKTCHQKFSNAINFGGFAFVPTRNPSTSDINR